MATKEIKVPNIGDVSDVEVIEVLVSPGDKIKKEDSLITLESDKASMEIPASDEGVVSKIHVKVGDKVSEGALILTLDVSDKGSEKAESKEKKEAQKKEEKVEGKTEKESTKETTVKIRVPDIGDARDVEVIEILVKKGSEVKQEDSLITLESEKASMEIPSPYAGKVEDIKVKVGDKVSQGDEILTLMTKEEVKEKKLLSEKEARPQAAAKPAPTIAEKEEQPESREELSTVGARVHAGPSVRRLAREFGISLEEVKGTGPKSRILKEDLQNYVKTRMSKTPPGFAISKMPEVDFSKFGEIEEIPLNRIKKLTGANVHRSWVTIPHVTQFDEADITEMEEFRQSQKKQVEKEGVKLTPLVFIMKAVIASLKEFKHFNASLDSKGENLILKKYLNLGIAVDTPNGLVVPVVRDVDKKSMLELAKELGDISYKAREKGLSPADMAGSCFTISSLGGIGGTAFTPIINAPDVAILGVSKSSIKPVYQKGEFVPRLMLPLSLSYDHRVIDGADGARFLAYLASRLADIRTLLL